MRNNKAILDEAARSVRRTFISSVAGSVVMLGVVGAAGAYGMPEKLTAKMLGAAISKLNVRVPGEPSAVASVPSSVVVAENTVQRNPMAMSVVKDVTDVTPVKDLSPVSDVTPAKEFAPIKSVMPVKDVTTQGAQSSVVKTVPDAVAPVAAPAMVLPSPAPAPSIFTPSPIIAMPVPEPARKEVASLVPVVSDPAPSIAAPVTPPTAPPAASDPLVISAPMVFEAPKAADIQTFSKLPKTETVISPEAGKANAMATPEPVELPKNVMLRMPIPKPAMTPAQRLELQGKDYDKAEKCLAQAVYFEARAEPVRGQMAVAQVVLNRVFSPYYPKDICSVVYQNASHFLSCQFTFTCDGKPETINESGPWARANRIAKEALAAKIWLPEVAKATHYHASYVHPGWVRDMKVMAKFGVHTFYRPRNWGDGSNEPAWGAGAVKKAVKS